MRLADLKVDTQDLLVCVTLTGEIDMSNAHELRDELSSLIPNEALGLVLDLTAVDYIDSAGIHMMFRLRESLRTRGQGFRLVIPEGALVNDTLRLAGIGRSEEVTETVEAARESLLAANPSSQR